MKEIKKEKMMTIRDFIEKNEPILAILGILLAVLSLSFEFINSINKTYAGYLSLSICLVIFLLILEMLKGSENFSLRTLIFLGGIIGITILIFLVIKENYDEEYIRILKLCIDILFFALGFIISIRLIGYIHKKISNSIKYTSLSLLILIFLILFSKFILNSMQLVLLFLTLEKISSHFLQLFLSEVAFVIFFYTIVLFFNIIRLVYERFFEKRLSKNTRKLISSFFRD